MISLKNLTTAIITLFIINLSYSQKQNFFTPSDTLNITRKKTVYYTYSIGSPISLAGLYNVWYKDGGMSNFKFVNDNRDWLQMDKFGHATTSYYLGEYAIKSLKWAGVERNRAIWHGGLAGFIYMAGIEILDGFANDYGFSFGDIIANTFGTSMLMAQEFLWDEQRFRLKFSFLPSDYAKYRPELLGNNLISMALKDYNGQTYWLSMNLKSNLKTDIFPNWLNIAFAYSASGMTGELYNPKINSGGKPIPHFERTRHFLFSFDIDLTKLNPKSDFLKTLCSVFGVVKFPFTTIEYNKNDGFVLHPIYF